MSTKNKMLKNRANLVNGDIQELVQLLTKLGAKIKVHNYCPANETVVVITNATDSDNQSIELCFDNKTGKLKS
jgi:hypothetical protein